MVIGSTSKNDQVKAKLIINVFADEDNLSFMELLITKFLRQYKYEIVYFDIEVEADIIIFDLYTWESIKEGKKDIFKTDKAKVICVFDKLRITSYRDGKIIYTSNLKELFDFCIGSSN